MSGDRWDALVVGGGFYGCCIALHLRRKHGLARVGVVERGPGLLGRASFTNQARVHQGYHYPRDFTTAYRSRANFARFVERYRPAVHDRFLKLYAIARRGSHVTARQFERFMAGVGAPCAPASRRHAALFSPALVEGVFEVEEFAFDASALAGMLADDLDAAGVEVILGTEASVLERGGGEVRLRLDGPGGVRDETARAAFVCVYGRTGHVPGAPPVAAGMRFQIAELCLVRPPPELEGVGVTLMDGPFFSCMPFPARGLHSLSHVVHTPREAWSDADLPERDPYAWLERWRREGGTSGFPSMLRDAARFLPAIAGAEHVDSLFEIKALLSANAKDDGRPILVEGTPAPGEVVTVLGGKLDNIFDVLEDLDGKEKLTP